MLCRMGSTMHREIERGRPAMALVDHGLVRLLDLVPELAEGLQEDQADLARRLAVAPAFDLAHGDRLGAIDLDEARGFVVVRGALMCSVAHGDLTVSELAAPGDVLYPDTRREEGLVSLTDRGPWTAWRGGARVAAFDSDFSRVLVRFPALAHAISERAGHRAATIMRQFAIAQVRRLDCRVHLLLWLLAERFGKVTGDGVQIDLELTQALLAGLTGSQRSSVSPALRRLTAEGKIYRTADRRWVLLRPPGSDAAAGFPPAIPERRSARSPRRRRTAHDDATTLARAGRAGGAR